MRSSRTVLAAAIMFGAALSLHALTPQAPAAAPQNPPAGPPTAAPPAGDPPRAVPPGRGGGRGNPAAALYTETCAGCHGTGLEGGRAPSLFDDKWIHASDDESIAQEHPRRHPEHRDGPFKASLTDQQIWQLVAYLRTQAANLKEQAGLRARSGRTDHQVGEADVQDRGRRAEPRDAVGARVSARRPPAHDRASRPPAHRRERQAAARAGQGHAEGVGEAGRRPARRRGASASTRENGWIYLAYSETVPGYTPPAAAAGSTPAPPPRSRASRRRVRPRPRRSARSAVDDGDRARQDQQEQRVGRSAGAVPRPARALQLEQRALRIALHLRQAGPLFFTLGEKNR